MMDKKEIFMRVGLALYGSRWQTDMAHDLGFDARRIRQWVSGDRPIPDKVWDQVVVLILNKQSSLDLVHQEVKKLISLLQ